VTAIIPVILGAAILVAGASLTYVVACILVAWGWRRPDEEPALTLLPAVAVLKPLCGVEPGLEENLRSFCEQTHPSFQILFGARLSDDPALAVARRVAARYPGRDIRVLAGAIPLGANQKINTLAHLVASARHDVLVIADSDIRVGPTYLQRVTAPLTDPSVGVVTCLYWGAPTRSIWSRLGALAIDEWFLPSVLISRALGSSTFCSGATMAIRRDVLERIGGFAALAPVLADDHELGRRVRALGLRTVISRYEVATTVHEPGLDALVQHELRWMRTVRTVEPIGHALCFVTYALPMTLIAAMVVGLFAPGHRWVVALPLAAIVLRVILHYTLNYVRRPVVHDRASVWLVPLRDVLSFAVWAASFASRRVQWRQQTMRVRADGVLRAAEEVTAA
jgi:ceramide glucosyltransferase